MIPGIHIKARCSGVCHSYGQMGGPDQRINKKLAGPLAESRGGATTATATAAQAGEPRFSLNRVEGENQLQTRCPVTPTY